MTINLRGYVFDDGGAAVSGATVKAFPTGETTGGGDTATGSTTTSGAGLWYFSAIAEDQYDVEITKGSSIRRIRWDDQIAVKEIDVRNNTGNTTPALTAVNLTNNAANQVAVFRSDRGTGNAADGDAAYVSFNLRNDNNEEHEFARITATAVDVSNGNEDGRFTFSVATGTDGGLDEIFVIDSSTGSAATISYEVDSFTIKGGEGEAGVLYLFADQGDDAGDEWKVNIADGGVMTIGNDIASAGTYVTHLTVTPHATITSSSVTFPGILDVNGSVDWDVTDVQVDSSGDIDLVSTANSAAAIYLQENGGTSGTIKIHADQGTSVTEGAESVTILSDAGGVGIRSTANLANAVNITVDGGTTSSMTLFNDQGTGATEGSASIQLLSDVGGINIKSGLNGANAILLTADGGTSETIVIHADQGTGTGSIELLSDAGGIELDAGTDIILDAGGADIFLKDDGTLFGTLTNNSGELLIKSSSSGTTAATFSGANVTFAGTVDATTDFTIGSTVITDDVITFTPSSSDTVTMTSATNGAFSLVTVDAAAAAANIQITADGTVDIDSAGVLTLDSGAAINIEPASGSAILLDGTISIDAGVVTGATSITSTAFVGDITGDVTGTADTATVATTVTITDNESTDEDNAIIFTAGGDVDGGNIGLESDGTLTYNPSTGKVTATGFVGTLTGNVTGNASGTAATVTSGTQASITTVANVVEVGALDAGSITSGFGAIDNGTSGIRTNTFTAETSIVPDAASGATLGTTSLEWGHLYIGDDQKIYLGDGQDVSLEYDEDGTDQLRISGKTVFDNDMEIADSKFVEFASAAGTPTTDNTVQGIVIEFLAVEAITQFDAVYVSTTTGRVGRADANDAAKMPVIGIAIEAQGSAGSSVRVLTHGVYRDDGGFGGNMTVGVDLYAPETPGTLTTTRPSDDGDFIQVIGVATGVRSAFINPNLTVIEHA